MMRAGTYGGGLVARRGLVVLLALITVGCGAPELTDEGDEQQIAGDDANDVTMSSSPLVMRWRWRARRSRPPAAPPVVDAGGTGGTGGSAAGGAVNVGVTGLEPTFVNGGKCPNNAPMPAGGPCGPYGTSCTYDDATGTHYCTCLPSGGPGGAQGWVCR